MIILRQSYRWLIATSMSLLCFSCQMDEDVLSPNENLLGEDIDDLLLLQAYASDGELGDWNIVYEETFESENPFYAYVTKQFSEDHSFKVSSSPSFKGDHVGRFELRKTDAKATRTGKRAEILVETPTGAENWYSFAVYFPSNGFEKDNDDEVISQWHNAGTPTLSLRVVKDDLIFRVGHDSNLKTSLWDHYDFGSVPKDEWVDFVFHIVHSDNSDGLVEVWRNDDKILTHSGPNKYKGERLPRWKVGIYKDAWDGKTTDTDKRILYFDNIRIGNEKASYEEMDPKKDNNKGWGPKVPEIESFSLINTITDKALGVVPNDGIINLKPIGDNRISLRANFEEEFEGSVEFELEGPKSFTVVRNEAEYCIYGYDKGNYHNGGGTPKGVYTLTATPYIGHNKSGKIGKQVVFNFTIDELNSGGVIQGGSGDLLENNLINITDDSQDLGETNSGTENNEIDVNPNLVGHWNMDEGNGRTLYDESGMGNHATIENDSDVSWVNGKLGKALEMNGRTGRYAYVSHNSSLNITESITISAWIRPSKKARKQILSKGNVYEFSIFENGKVEFRINRDTNAKDFMIQSVKSYPTDGDTWMHVAATFDGRNSVIYINGEKDHSSTYNSTKINSNSTAVQVGAKYGNNRWTGALDDLRLYNTALSASQIKSIYN
ncbi:heparin lyase I family protein [Cyclobacterium marinum]|uniref:LamG domain protein jellyroll fold domain protein n=1 Tax=Cyclobacterium marinum (strain ATCC 25205 / DSM 745 / LMG 13164 / NCIMB 1802) TaxID=880070 RepID=G0J0U0_CYCMS|nr:heparin lyase I family protein [Cyclobacterium marinum]AEL24502.1 LamG domain protein jellyroll fold domain protein [Cyclobacterium marinum DSM 745]